jgi:hypothetical protein
LLPLHPLICCFKKVGTAEVMCDVSRGFFLLLAPIPEQALPFSLHNIHHSGVRAARRLVCPSFCWQKKWGLLFPLLPCTVGKERFIAHVPLASATTVDCTAALYKDGSRGLASITSDRGLQLKSSLWASLCSLLSISRNHTSAYHPYCNVLGEGFDCCVKDACSTTCQEQTGFHSFLG